jgi:hypothetical protein
MLERQRQGNNFYDDDDFSFVQRFRRRRLRSRSTKIGTKTSAGRASAESSQHRPLARTKGGLTLGGIEHRQKKSLKRRKITEKIISS